MAENVAESLQKGQHVIVHGALNVRQYERQDGGRGTSVEMNVYEVGASLRFATAKVTKASRGGGGGGGGDFGGGSGGGGGYGGGQGGGNAGGGSANPWSSPQAAPQGGNDAWGGGGAAAEEPPF